MQSHSWSRSILLGAFVGLPVLGGGGRLAMRAVAAATDAQAAVSVEGTITVLLAGAASGAAAGAIYHALAALLPQRTWLRDAGFVLLLCALTLRGLNPVQALPLALFGPVMAVFAVAYVSAWRRFTSRPVVVEPAV